jgi:hypothetical protein
MNKTELLQAAEKYSLKRNDIDNLFLFTAPLGLSTFMMLLVLLLIGPEKYLAMGRYWYYYFPITFLLFFVVTFYLLRSPRRIRGRKHEYFLERQLIIKNKLSQHAVEIIKHDPDSEGEKTCFYALQEKAKEYRLIEAWKKEIS